MRPFEHFGLKRPAFEMKPDPRVFLKSPSHVEALATLQYTLYAGKACSVVAGESGSGKTLLARVIANACSRKTDILWVDAFGHPQDRTDCTLYTPAANTTATASPAVTETETTLADWARSGMRRRTRTLLIVDDADVLSCRGWQDILMLMTRCARSARQVSIVLLGLPKLLDVLAGRDMARVRRRVFRIGTLSLLTRDQVEAYLDCRVTAAGREDGQLFTEQAVDSIYRVSRGNPALINQLCDNAMINAYGDGRDQIDVGDIMSSLRSTLFVQQPLLPEPPADYAPKLLLSGSTADDRLLPRSAGTDRAADGDETGDVAPSGSDGSHVEQPVRVVTSVALKSSPAGSARVPSTSRSLQAIEARVARALNVVRKARTLTDDALGCRPPGSAPRRIIENSAEVIGVEAVVTSP